MLVFNIDSKIHILAKTKLIIIKKNSIDVACPIGKKSLNNLKYKINIAIKKARLISPNIKIGEVLIDFTNKNLIIIYINQVGFIKIRL